MYLRMTKVKEEVVMEKQFMDKLKIIADKLGFENQSRQLFEETAELTVAVNKLLRYGKIQRERRLQGVITELADVSIMIEQMKYLLNCQKEVDEEIEFKIDRTIRRLEKNGTNEKLS